MAKEPIVFAKNSQRARLDDFRIDYKYSRLTKSISFFSPIQSSLTSISITP